MSNAEFNLGAAHCARHLHQVVGYIKDSMPTEDDEMYLVAHRALAQVQKACTDAIASVSNEVATSDTTTPPAPQLEEPSLDPRVFPKNKKAKEAAEK